MPDNDASEDMPDIDTAYVLDDEDEEQPSNNHRSRRSNRVMAKHRENNKDCLHRNACLAENEMPAMPYLSIMSRIFTRGLGGANMNLQMSERDYEYFLQDQSLMKI